MQRRHYLMLAAVGLVIILLSLLLQAWDRGPDPVAPPTSADRDRPPDRGRDRAPVDAAPAADRLAPAFATLRCTGGEGTLMAISGADARRGTGLSLALPPGEWSVYLEPPEGGPASLGHVEVDVGDELRCTLFDGLRPARGRVVSPRGRPVSQVLVRADCPGNETRHTETDARGAFTIELPARGCDVSARLQSGALTRQSDPVHVTPFDQDVEIEISLDDRPVAGLGITLAVEDGGVRVQDVHPGTPAAESGMASNDLIVAIDGKSVVGLDADQFRAIATGEEGTRVTVDVLRDGQRRNFQFRRRQISMEATLPAFRPPIVPDPGEGGEDEGEGDTGR